MQQFIIDLPAVGPLVKQWQDHRIIAPRAKVLSVLTIILIMSSSIYFVAPPNFVKITMLIIAIGVISFIMTRKSA